MSEKILEICETTFTKTEEKSWYTSGYDGFVIKTDKQEIKLGIQNSQCCCESWGYFMSEDDTARFVGADLLDIKITNCALNKEKLQEVYEGDTMFVDIETSEGVLQFVAYNCHNGYYGHDALVQSEQLNYSECL